MYQTMRELLIGILMAIIIFGGLSLGLKDAQLSPDKWFYSFKTAGEWLDVNLLTFGAVAKQRKHLQFTDRRLEEFTAFFQAAESSRLPSKEKLKRLNRSYEKELASSYFMAEQLALIGPEYLGLLEDVYLTSLAHLEKLEKLAGTAAEAGGFAVSAQLYNSKAIKTLLQKHQYTPADTKRYQALVAKRLAWVESRQDRLSEAQLETLQKAKAVLAEGVEIEWAYDLLSSIR